MFPVAPARFSTMTLWPSVPVMSWASWRAMMSLAVPGPNGTTIMIGLFGKSCAPAGQAIVTAATAAIAAATAARRDHFVACMNVLPCSFNWLVRGIKVLEPWRVNYELPLGGWPRTSNEALSYGMMRQRLLLVRSCELALRSMLGG